MKKLIALLLSLCLILALVGCAQNSKPMPADIEDPIETEPPISGMPNPMQEMTMEELAEKTGFTLQAPADAENVTYFAIEQSESAPIAEMRFTANGKNAYLRVIPTNVVDLSNAEAVNVSGLFYEWTQTTEATVAGRSAMCYTDGNAGYITWIDVVPGVLYNLCMSEGADAETLQTLAESVFAPTQGEADGE